MDNRMAIFGMVIAVIAIVYSLIAIYRTLVRTLFSKAMDYANMCERIKSVENDVRANSGDHFPEKEYLDRADKMNQSTDIFSWINTPRKPMSNEKPAIQADSEKVRERYEMLLALFAQKFLPRLAEQYHDSVYISRELLHCAVKAYFDDIERYKAYAGSKYADRHKQAAYTMKWINQFRPIQIRENIKADAVLVTINQSFAIYAGFVFLDPLVMAGISESFFHHLVYTLTYRSFTAKMLATLIYTIECVAEKKESV